MKANRTNIALIAAGLLAVVAAVIGVRSPVVGVEGVVGFTVVALALGFAAIDYRLSARTFSK
jgi:F0F1-type ATP synthase assembly protein I